MNYLNLFNFTFKSRINIENRVRIKIYTKQCLGSKKKKKKQKERKRKEKSPQFVMIPREINAVKI